ncbi:GHKL domain protein [Halobacteriovorax sp. BALOs_7]|uniref:hypothetical protein n=1 Tax=Halobacteriovorax sp. BALOs_7 TaxID=2109558 RepID=UPI000EB740FC|nr:hypothetical protein [Halobacteriovorax sp. BALOs_7]AYF44428.1 GHKL domain protein [Halobacteriovorax sp. BALOs_7]
MYEYLNTFLAGTDISVPELWSAIIYICITVGASFYLISMGISGLSLQNLSNKEPDKKIQTSIMCFAQAVVCFFIIAHFFMPIYSKAKVATTLLMFICTYTARYYYWENLSKVFDEPKAMRWVYKSIVFGAISLCLIHLLWMAFYDVHTCCLGPNLIKSNANNFILKVQIPFVLNKSFSGLVAFFTLAVSVVYIRFFLISLKQGDRLMIFGLLLSVLNILYTTSFHAFGFQYWIPLYFIVDLIEYTRLQQLELSQSREQYRSHDESYRMVIHDIANPIQFSSLKLNRLKRNSLISLDDANDISTQNSRIIEALNNHKKKN